MVAVEAVGLGRKRGEDVLGDGAHRGKRLFRRRVWQSLAGLAFPPPTPGIPPGPEQVLRRQLLG